ncbi:MAG TPA: hypothetical protein VG147_00175 [Solirubrobacteraceae bacterium]|nr:hypothetical protein [Solirubrobacteraceae bacterium]
MRIGEARIGLVALLCCAASGVVAPAAHAGFGVEEKHFEAGTCTVSSCTYAGVEADRELAYTQAAGHPQYGITGFEFNSTPSGLGREPIGNVKRVRVDVPPGLAADPEALPACPVKTFEADACPAETEVGKDELTAFVAAADVPISAPVYNLAQPAGLPLDFGIHVSVTLVANEHIFLEGHVSWNTDFHEYFEINEIPRSIPLLKSKLIFDGRAGEGNFLTLPSVCSTTTTSYLEVESWEGEISKTQTHTPVGVEGCDRVPFAPTAEVHPETATSDEPDGVTAEVKVPQNVGAEAIDTADVDDARVTLPEGLTLNPSAAHGLAACTEAQAGLAQESPGVRPTGPVTCPAAAKVASVDIETDLPPGSLTGNVYLGSPTSAPIAGPPYTIYVDAESALGVSVRLQGQVTPNPATGRLEATFAGNPPLPFADLAMRFDGGPLAPLANPLSCAAGAVEGLFTPYTGGAAALSSTPFAATGCPAPLMPFALGESTHDTSATAGAYTSYTFALTRAGGQQYLADVKATLPAGLLGAIPSVALCAEAQADAGTCPAASEIGSASVSAGAGPEPYGFAGKVYLTGPYGGAPYGLSIVVPASAGPFDFGDVIARAGIGVGLYTGRAVVTAALPTIVQGVPLRLRAIEVAVDRPHFLFNPTACSPLATESQLVGFVPGSPALTEQSVSSPFQVGECGKLAFTPTFTAAAGARVSRVGGASLEVKVTQAAHQADIREVLASLPKQLAARITTLHKACPAATFEAGPPPGGCSAEARVGSATVTTPVLPGPLTGPAYLVSHGGEAYPDLDVILSGDGGVEVVLVGHTHIASTGILSSAFESLPDVPLSSFALSLPTGPHSVLTDNRNGTLCGSRLTMPTTIVAQSGARIAQRTAIAVTSCPRKKLRHGHGHRRRRRRRRVHRGRRRGARRSHARARG